MEGINVSFSYMCRLWVFNNVCVCVCVCVITFVSLAATMQRMVCACVADWMCV